MFLRVFSQGVLKLGCTVEVHTLNGFSLGLSLRNVWSLYGFDEGFQDSVNGAYGFNTMLTTGFQGHILDVIRADGRFDER